MLYLLPLLVALALLVVPLLSPFSRRVHLFVSRLALPVFGFYVANESPRRSRQIELLRASHVATTHRVYASRTLFFVALAGVVGSIVGVYLVAGVVYLLRLSADTLLAVLPSSLEFLANLARIPQLDAAQLFGLFLVSSATLGTLCAVGVYWARWYYLESRANARASEIEASLPRTVAFVYALSRSGMPFPTVLETLSRNKHVYGEAATEVGIAVRDIDLFGTDVLTALQRMSTRTPSDGLEEFGENLASVLGSGRSLSEFLHEQYERYQEEAEAQQEQYLDLLSTFAEIYVTVLVAGPLFFITVLVVIGLVLSDTLTLIRIVGYLGIPLASAGFIVYIQSMTQTLKTVGESPEDESRSGYAGGGTESTTAETPRAASDGGGVVEDPRWQRSRERLAAYDRFEPVRRWIDDPVRNLLGNPRSTLAVSLPVALVWLLLRMPSFGTLIRNARVPRTPLGMFNGPTARVLDGPLIEATVFVLAVYAVVYELQKRRTRALENAVPDFLDRLASVNEAGLTVTESIGRVRGSDLGKLGPEIDRMWRDIQWGADAQTALRRLDRRTGAVLISQAVTLITNAMKASGDIAPVLRIAADEAQDNRRLRRERRQEMFTYLLVIYISFLVFLGIITALSVAFIPAINAASGAIGGGGGAGGGVGVGLPGGTFGGIDEVNTAQYSILFFHIAAIQAVCSGLIAGLLGEGDLQDGVKHATILLAFAYVVSLTLF